MSKTIYHRHHIIPRHAGGTDDPSNIVELTIEEHAEAHRKLYEEHGRWQDKMAWLGLAGLIGKDEIILEMYRNPEIIAKRSASQRGKKRGPHSEETKEKIRVSCKGMNTGPRSEETKEKIRKTSLGRKFSEETKAKLSAAKTGKKHTEETKAKLSAVLKGREFSEETRAKLRAGQKRRREREAALKNLE